MTYTAHQVKQYDAHRLYLARLGEARERIAALKGELNRHQADAKRDPADYGYAGDLAHVNAKLDEIWQFLKFRC